ncbi:MAG: class I tRNA ligase family protein, partial [Bacillota bacterium]|nr:class I tRNA ligase family protein [Bacillota bacterium]
MGKTYEPRSFEEKIYQMWEEKESFKADTKSTKEKFSIVLPPPNITGQLHMGHALDGSLQDVMVRFKRLQGFDVLWLPGTDHASIATEVKVWEALAEEGFKKEEVSRERFLERAWQWKEMYESRILSQMKKLGNSCDWSKLRFTMDEGCNKAVTRYFVDMYRDGLIYKGERMINWCVDCETSISDLEVEHEEKDGNLYYLKYMLEGSEDFIEVATTRPETIFGDTAVAVNPENPKYKHLIGKQVCVPICGRMVQIIGDDYVDIEFGTGALKVTPSHDVNDFEIGERHGLESLRVLELDGSMNRHAGKYEGLSREECRKQVVKDLEEAGLLLKKEPHKHSVGTCYRCHKNIEPMVSLQWFAKTDEVAKRGIEEL